jgi:hypothetical protein
MKLLVVALAFAIAACEVQPDPAFGTRTIIPTHCHDPQTSYARDVTNLRHLGLSDWRVQSDSTQSIDVEVSCDDFTSDCLDFHIMSACGPQAGYFDLGASVVHVDQGRANGEFAFSGVQNHELVHWYIFHGPHPDRARLHICPCGVTSPECWPDGCGSNALMNPVQSGLGTSTATTWDGMTEHVDVGMLTINDPTDLDARFVRWAATP